MASTLVHLERYRSAPPLARARRAEDCPPPESPFRRHGGGAKPQLSDRQVAHRRRMLDHLSRAGRGASGTTDGPPRVSPGPS